MYCIKCGVKNDDDAKFCIACGENTGIVPEVAQNNQSEKEVSKDLASNNPTVTTKKKSKLPFVIIGTILLLALTVFITFMVISASPASKAKKELKLANQYLDEMNYEMAIASYTKAIEIDPKNVDAYEGLANTYVAMAEKEIKTGNMELAITYYETAIEILTQGEAVTGDESLAECKAAIEKIMEEQKNGFPKANSVEGAEFAGMTVEEIMQASIGDVVTYGIYGITNREYEYKYDDYYNREIITEISRTSDIETSIEWVVLDNDGDSVTLLSLYVLDNMPYDFENRYKQVTWENSVIREWLNNDFYNQAFSEVEKMHIQNTSCKNADNPCYGTGGEYDEGWPESVWYPAGGNDTQDKVYLLSLDDLETYFNVKPADYNQYCNGQLTWEVYSALCDKKSGNLFTLPEGRTYWWLRSTGSRSGYAADVDCEGGVEMGGTDVTCVGGVEMGGTDVTCVGGVRPVIRIGL